MLLLSLILFLLFFSCENPTNTTPTTTTPTTVYPGDVDLIKTKYFYPMEDTFVLNINPERIYNWYYHLLTWSSSNWRSWILLKYWTSGFEYSEILSVNLVINDYNGSEMNGSDTIYFDVYKITMGWFEDKTNWNYRPSYDENRIGLGSIYGSEFVDKVPLPISIMSYNLGFYGIAIVPTGAFQIVDPGTTVVVNKAFPTKEFDEKGIYLEVQYKE